LSYEPLLLDILWTTPDRMLLLRCMHGRHGYSYRYFIDLLAPDAAR
jgi:hypothetical protein